MATQIFSFPDPATLPLEDNFSVTELIAFPPLVDCQWKPKSCAELWCKVKCPNDLPYTQPVIAGDKIVIQTQFLDYQNVPEEFRCKPPLKPGKAVAQFRLVDKPTVVFGDPNNCIVFCYDWSFTGCLGVGDFVELRTCSYANFDDWREGVLSFYETLPQIGNPAKRRIGNDTLELEWDIEEFELAYGFKPCGIDLIFCFYDKSNGYRRVGSGDPLAPQIDIVFPFTCCPADVPCAGLAKVETGCSVPDGFASLKFQIFNDPSYVFGEANQISQNVADVGLKLVRASENCPAVPCFIRSKVEFTVRRNQELDYLTFAMTLRSYCAGGSPTIPIWPTPPLVGDNILDTIQGSNLGADVYSFAQAMIDACNGRGSGFRAYIDFGDPLNVVTFETPCDPRCPCDPSTLYYWYFSSIVAGEMVNVGTAECVNTPVDTLDPLLLFSQATDFSDYIDRFATWLSTNILLPGDIINYDNTTGEFEILFDKVVHLNDGWDVCEGIQLCEVRYPISSDCDSGGLKEVSFIFDNFTTDPATHDAYIQASDGTFLFTATAIDTTTLNDFILDFVDYFNTNILGTSYAVPFSGVPNMVNASGFNGIKIFLDTTVYTDVCDSDDWRFSIDDLFSRIRVYETAVCCDRACSLNETGYVSFDFYLPDPGTFTYLAPSDFALFYNCANGIPATLFGASPLTIGTPSDWNDLLDRLTVALNTPTLTAGSGLPAGIYAQRFGDSIRIKIPTGDIPLGCTCERINWRIRITESAIAYYRMVENRNCCQSDCTVPPEQVKVEITIYDDPSYVFGNPNNEAWIYIIPNDGDCNSMQPIGVVRTSDVANLGEYAEAVQVEWTKFFGSFGGKTSFLLEQVGSDYKITGYIDRWAYNGATGYDPCNGLKICYKNEYSIDPPGCFAVTEINVTVTNFPVGTTDFEIQLLYNCTCYFAAIVFSEVISVLNTDTPAIVAGKIAAVFGARPGWIASAVGSKVTIKTPCDEIDPCSCVPLCATDSYIKIYYNLTTTKPIPSVFTAISSYKGCEMTSEPEGTPFVINAGLTQDNSCCDFCDNPFGYISTKVRISSLSFDTFTIQINGSKTCAGGIQINSDSLYLTATSFEESAQFISNVINNRLTGDAFARADGDILTIWILNNRDCPCDDGLITVYLDEFPLTPIKPTDCCTGAGTPGVYQSIDREITENNLCCNDYLINIELVDCNCNPLVLYNPIPECLHPGKARATFDLASFSNLDGCTVTITSLEDTCIYITPFEYLFNNLSSYESQLQDWVDAINLGSPGVTASRDGLKLILDFDLNFEFLVAECCINTIFWRVICELSTLDLESPVECCPTEPTLFSIFDALDSWMVGQNHTPYLQFLQNLQFDPDKIPTDCFAFKISDSRGNVHFTECYQKERCLETVLLCSEFAEGKKDCEGYIYGIPEYFCPEIPEPVYSNCVRVRGQFLTESYDYATDGKKRTTTPKYKLRTEILPPFMVQRINAVLGGKNITINGIPVTIDGTISRNKETGTMWSILADFTGETCTIDETCENQ